MVKIQKRVRYGQGILQYYTTKNWRFINENFRSLRKSISKSDDEVFFTDMEVWFIFFFKYIFMPQQNKQADGFVDGQK